MRTLLLNLLLAYLMLVFVVYFFGDLVVFLPAKSTYMDNEKIIKITRDDGSLISGVYLPNRQAKYTLLVSHGNAEDLGSMYPFLEEMRQHGFAVFAYDYSGYGTSQGRATEKNTYHDVVAAYRYLTDELQVPGERIIVYGRSVGAAVALYLAIHEKVAALVMESPFVTAVRVLTRIPLLPFDKYNNLARITQLSCPLLVIHGIDDKIIPIWHAKKLYARAEVAKQYFWVPKAGHNNVLQAAGENYWYALRGFVSSELP